MFNRLSIEEKLEAIEKNLPRPPSLSFVKAVPSQEISPPLLSIMVQGVLSRCSSSDLYALRGSFLSELSEETVSKLSVRIPRSSKGDFSTSKDSFNSLVTEAYVGLVHTNALRGVTRSFKYIYSYWNQSPLIVEEKLSQESWEQLLPLAKEKAISVVSQLYLALIYAHSHGLSSFPKEISLERVSEETTVPVLIGGEVKHLPTHGLIPVFSSLEMGGSPKTLKRELEELWGWLSSLFREHELPKKIPQEVLVALGNPFPSFSFLELSEMEISRFMNRSSPPSATMAAVANSLLMRMDELRGRWDTETGNDKAIVGLVIVKYASMLEALWKEHKGHFKEERVFRGAQSNSRYLNKNAGLVKSDIAFIKECLILPTSKPSPRSLAKIIEGVTRIEKHDAKIIPGKKPINSLLSLLKGLRDTVSHLFLYEITDSLLSAASLSPRYKEALEFAECLREEYEMLLFSSNLSHQLPVEVTRKDDAVLVLLYGIFIKNEIPKPLSISYRSYISLNNQHEVLRESFLALDPVIFL